MQRQCRVQKGSHQGLVALGDQGRITAAAQNHLGSKVTLIERAWNGWRLMTIVRFMQQRDYIEEGIILRLSLTPHLI